MMIHCKALLMVPISTTRITPSGKNQLIQYLEQAYLVTMHLGMTEKSLFTEVIIFENSRIRNRTLICVRGSNTALPLSYTASNYTVVRENCYEKDLSPSFGESYRSDSNRKPVDS